LISALFQWGASLCYGVNRTTLYNKAFEKKHGRVTQTTSAELLMSMWTNQNNKSHLQNCMRQAGALYIDKFGKGFGQLI
jgi:hypothetical protein